MKLETISTIARIILTLALVYAAYMETGIFTGICLLLLCLNSEAETFLRRKGDEK